MKLTNGKVYEITDNTVVFIELEGHLTVSMRQAIIETY